MAIKTSSSPVGDLNKVLNEIDQPGIKCIIYFYSVDQKSKEFHKHITQKFPKVPSIGGSMIGGWSEKDGLIEKGITAMSLSDNEIDKVYISLQKGVKTNPSEAAKLLINDIKRQIGPNEIISPLNYFGIILVDGLCLGEVIMKELMFTKGLPIPIIGGASADELTFTETLVSANDVQSNDGVALMVCKTKVPFFYNHYVHYVPTNKEFIITNASPEKRIVWEIEGEPAAEYYAKLLSLKSVNEIKHTHFAENPLGVVIGGAVYTRSPNAVIDGKGLQFYCFIEAGTRMQLLKKSNIIANAEKAMRDANVYLEKVEGAILFNCVLRYLEMQNDKKITDFARVFSSIPFIGFNTYGEELFTHHNQTLTALFIGS